jgi:DNA recombination protein RmuC
MMLPPWLADHWRNVGSRLESAGDAYNKSVGALESRVLPAARRFRELKAAATDKDIKLQEPIEQTARILTAHELVAIAAEVSADA